MANPFFQALGMQQKQAANPMINFIGQFPSFMKEMKGKNPNEMINELLTSGKINQQQLNAVQQQAQQIMGMFDQFKGKV